MRKERKKSALHGNIKKNELSDVRRPHYTVKIFSILCFTYLYLYLFLFEHDG